MSERSIFTRQKSWKRRDPTLPPTPQKRWANANREKLKAHQAVRTAIKNGVLKRGRCEVCQSFRCEAHHDSYDRPLDVRWFCRRHHQQLHSALRRAAA